MKLPGTSGVYRIRNTINNHSYVGSARVLNTRRNSHFYLLRRGKHHSAYLQRSWNKYGEASFVVEVLELCPTNELRDREQWWIDNSECVYNGCSTAHSPALDAVVKVKIGAASKRKGERFLVRGKMISVSDIRALYGVGHTVFYCRLQRGWDVERAATEPPERRRTAEGSRIHEYNGRLHTLQELVPFAQCSKTALFRRIKAGMSVKDAVEMTKEQADKLRAEKVWRTRRGNKCT